MGFYKRKLPNVKPYPPLANPPQKGAKYPHDKTNNNRLSPLAISRPLRRPPPLHRRQKRRPPILHRHLHPPMPPTRHHARTPPLLPPTTTPRPRAPSHNGLHPLHRRHRQPLHPPRHHNPRHHHSPPLLSYPPILAKRRPNPPPPPPQKIKNAPPSGRTPYPPLFFNRHYMPIKKG